MRTCGIVHHLLILGFMSSSAHDSKTAARTCPINVMLGVELGIKATSNAHPY
jgi:hypothetical protein